MPARVSSVEPVLRRVATRVATRLRTPEGAGVLAQDGFGPGTCAAASVPLAIASCSVISAWRQVCALLGGVLLVAPLTALVADLAGDTGGGPLVAGVIAGLGLGLLRLAGLDADARR